MRAKTYRKIIVNIYCENDDDIERIRNILESSNFISDYIIVRANRTIATVFIQSKDKQTLSRYSNLLNVSIKELRTCRTRLYEYIYQLLKESIDEIDSMKNFDLFCNEYIVCKKMKFKYYLFNQFLEEYKNNYVKNKQN